jgi:teichuronic acid biosynthesis glycosyltransferase TuaG
MAIVSVIIPTFNRAYLLDKTLESVLTQSIKDLEVLVCDDGSTDNTETLVMEFQSKDARVRWVPGAHTGLPASPRNSGIKSARGEWLALLDSDDLWYPSKLEKQLQSLRESGLKAGSCNAYRKFAQNEKMERYQRFEKDRWSFADLCTSNPAITSSVIFHRSILETVIGFPETVFLRGVEDYAFWLRVASQTAFAYLDAPLLEYNDGTQDSIRTKRTAEIPSLYIYIWKDFFCWAKTYRRFISNTDYRRAIACYRSKKLIILKLYAIDILSAARRRIFGKEKGI